MLGAASARMPFWRYWAAVAEPGLDEKLLLGLPPWLSNAAAYFIRPFLYLRRRITGDI